MKTTLRLGSRGPEVASLQTLLNGLASSLPPLNADGVFGPRTEARVREFQRLMGLAADGIVGALTWGRLPQPGTVAPPATMPPSSGPNDATRAKALRIAHDQVGQVDFSLIVAGRPKGIDLIKKFFAEAAGVTLDDSHFRDSKGAWTAVPILAGGAKSWCGIFCIWCYRQAGLTALRWNLATGRPTGPLALNHFSSSFVSNIKPADMGTVATQSHHFLIEGLVPGGSAVRPTLATIDGNGLFGRIESFTRHQVGKDNFNYYSHL